MGNEAALPERAGPLEAPESLNYHIPDNTAWLRCSLRVPCCYEVVSSADCPIPRAPYSFLRVW